MARPGFHGEQFARVTDRGEGSPALILGASIAADWLRSAFGRIAGTLGVKSARQAG